MEQVRGHAVEHLRGSGQAHASDDQLGPPVRREPHRVGPRRVDAVAFHALHGPAVHDDQRPHVVLVVTLSGTWMVADPAHVCLPRHSGGTTTTMPRGTDISELSKLS